MQKGKSYLKELEETGKYVFHGSADGGIQELEPRQAHNYPGNGSKKIPDGAPAVAASPYADIAIFRSLIGFGSAFGVSINEEGVPIPYFRAQKKTLDKAKEAIGFVYVLDKKHFKPKEGTSDTSMDWRCERSVEPAEVVKVTYADLPKDIKVRK